MRLAILVFVGCLMFIEGISQSDDYPDYRSKKEIFSRILEKDIRSDIASFAMGGLDESVGKLPLATIPVIGFNGNSISFSGQNPKTNEDIRVVIKSAPFNPTKHRLTYYDPEKKYLTKIDNKAYFGDYGSVPKTVVDSVIVIVGRDTVNVPAIALADLANLQLSFSEGGKQKTLNKVYLSADGRRIYVYLLKPEAGGSYEATWVIQDKKYLRRVVDFGFLR